MEIDHGNGYITRYAHNDELLVKAGDGISAGQKIAKMGATGRPSATLKLETKRGVDIFALKLLVSSKCCPHLFRGALDH